MLCFIFLLLSFFPLPSHQDLSGDTRALLSFRAAVGPSVLPWNTSVSTCQWFGIECFNNRVIALRLPGVGLVGDLPEGVIGNLTALRTLSLRYNALTGSLPADIGLARELRGIYLQHNEFSGLLPDFLVLLPNIIRLNLADNAFSGKIPESFGNFTRLATLYMENNELSGEIPNIDLPSLVQFNVSYNQLNGSVPTKLRKMPANAFLGMQLCGGPLGLCPGETAPSPSPSSDNVVTGGGDNGSGAVVGKSKSKLSGGAIAGVAIGATAILLLLIVLLFLICRRRGRSPASRMPKSTETEMALHDTGDNVNGSGYTPSNSSSAAAVAGTAAAAAAKGSTTGAKKLVFCGRGRGGFDLEDLLRASAEVLGKGTFGTAYKAVLENGEEVAVKRLRDVNLPETEFREKIEAVGALDHPNLVPLRAYYYSKDEKLLVHDYMPMGSLSALLHGNRGSGQTPLHWESRTAIALAAARGIEYIHSTSPTASHGNIKSSNILLAKSHDARVSDHGLAHLVGASSSPNRAGGYRAPEVTDARKISQKADVYSFGVLLLELLTGKAPAQALLNDEGVDLPRWVQSIVREEWTSEVFDIELLRYHNVEEEMVQLLQLAINCSAQYPDRRPSMSEVVVRIEEIHRASVAGAEQEKYIIPHTPGDTDDLSSKNTDSIGGSTPPPANLL